MDVHHICARSSSVCELHCVCAAWGRVVVEPEHDSEHVAIVLISACLCEARCTWYWAFGSYTHRERHTILFEHIRRSRNGSSLKRTHLADERTPKERGYVWHVGSTLQPEHSASEQEGLTLFES